MKATKFKITMESIQTSNIVANSQLSYPVNLVSVHDDSQLKEHIFDDVFALLNFREDNSLD